MKTKIEIQNRIQEARKSLIDKIANDPSIQDACYEGSDLPALVEKEIFEATETFQTEIEESHGIAHIDPIIEQLNSSDPEKLLSQIHLFTSHIKNVYPSFPYNYYEDLLSEKMAAQSEILNSVGNIKSKKLKAIRFKLKKIKENLLYSLQKELTKKHFENLDLQIKNRIIIIEQQIRERLIKFKMICESFSFIEETNKLWGMSKGNWSRNSLTVLAQWKKMLESDHELKALISQIGRSKSFNEFKEEMHKSMRRIDLKKYEWKYKEEVTGVCFGNDLTSMSVLDMSYLSDPETEILFYKKYVEKKLMNRLFRNSETESIMIEEEQKRQLANNKAQKGPVILCIDTSGSMNGIPETIAKMLTYNVIMKALSEERPVYLINFSVKIKVEEFNRDEFDLDKLCNFLQMSFNGGTDSTDAMHEALRKTREENFNDADILVVSDFCMGSWDPNTLQKIENAKLSGTRLMALIVSNDKNPSPVEHFDITWHLNLMADEKIRLIE